jgi:hypothetical protein
VLLEQRYGTVSAHFGSCEHYSDVLILTNVSTAPNIALLFWKLLVHAFHIKILRTSVRLMLTLNDITVLLLDAPQQQMPLTVVLIYLLEI